MSKLHVDFESRSACELKTAGLHNYAADSTTSPWCMAWAFDGQEPQIWALGQPLPDRVRRHVESGGLTWGHNVSFELAIWNSICVPRYGWPKLKPEQCRCTMAMAYAMALPGSLEKAAAAVGIRMQKDMAGHRLMMQMAKPRAVDPVTGTEWWDEPDKLAQLYEYCRQDVRVERELEKRLMPLSDYEQQVWALDQKINNRGVYVDLPAVEAAIGVVTAEQDRLNAAMREATGNFVGFTTETARLKKWVEKQGVALKGVAKNDVTELLDDPACPEHVKAALRIRREAGKSSTSKLRAMQEATSADSRLRGMFQYHGAATGRWAGRRVQLHNLPRPKMKADEIERAIDALGGDESPAEIASLIDLLYGSPLDVISWSLRSMLCAAPGKELIAADFANIEGRVLAWLADERWKLEAFRDYDTIVGRDAKGKPIRKGPDLYLVTASEILGKPIGEITDDERQSTGKVPELACGYQGSVGAFQNMAKVYGVKIADAFAQSIVDRWRDKNSRIRTYWYNVDAAAKDALRHVGAKVSTGPRGREVTYRVSGSFLWCRLPSGRVLCYPYARLDHGYTLRLEDGRIVKRSQKVIDRDGMPEGAEILREDDDVLFYMTVDSTSNKWVEDDTYGGKLVENIDQAVSRDLLAAAMLRVEAAGYPIVLHVHDEIVAEIPAGTGELAEFEALCAQTPPWAAGLPVSAAGWRGRRYRK